MTLDLKDDKAQAEYIEYGVAKEVNQASDSSVDLESLDIDEKKLIRKM